MPNKYLFLPVLSLLISFTAAAQPKIGETAPEIHITSWIKNIPQSKDLSGKFIVIDFWATWCAPCLESLPNFNKIVDNNRSRSNLVFLSLTDEKVNKVNAILKRIPFSAIVATDTSGQTFENLKVDFIPFCVVIDEENKIRWLGNTADFTDEILHKIVEGQPVAAPPKKQWLTEDVLKMYGAISTRYSNYMNDKELKEYFTVEPLTFQKYGSYYGLAGWKEMVVGDSLVQRFAKLLDVGESQILLPPDLIGACISYCYKSPVQNTKVDVLETILDQMKLKYKITDSLMDVIQLEVSDEKMLKKNVQDSFPRTGHASSSDNYAAIDYDRFNNLTGYIQERFRKTVIVKADRIFDRKLSITVKMDNLESLTESFNAYGIKTTLVKKKMPVYRFMQKI